MSLKAINDTSNRKEEERAIWVSNDVFWPTDTCHLKHKCYKLFYFTHTCLDRIFNIQRYRTRKEERVFAEQLSESPFSVTHPRKTAPARGGVGSAGWWIKAEEAPRATGPNYQSQRPPRLCASVMTWRQRRRRTQGSQLASGGGGAAAVAVRGESDGSEAG